MLERTLNTTLSCDTEYWVMGTVSNDCGSADVTITIPPQGKYNCFFCACVLYSMIETKAQLLVSLNLFPAVCPVASTVPPSGMYFFTILWQNRGTNFQMCCTNIPTSTS